MIRVCMFDMGGVMIRDFQIAPELSEYLGYGKRESLAKIDPSLAEAVELHSIGKITEEQVWKMFCSCTGKKLDNINESLLGKFFHPVLDQATVDVVKKLKAKGIRVICGTNVIDSHYRIHNILHQYDVFDKVYPSHLLGIRKPDKDFYMAVCQKENIKPEECFFTDDIMENVEAASSCGLCARLYAGAQKLESDLKELGLI